MAYSVLVVDDEPMARNLLRLMLVRDGIDVLEAANGHAALAIVASQHPDLVVLDVMMPELDGLSVCERLRRAPDSAEIPVIMLSAKTDRESIEQGMAAGATLYLRKPISAAEFTSQVRLILEQQSAFS